MDYGILPYVGAGVLRFGMSQADVSNLLGSPKLIEAEQGEVREYRMGNGLQIVFGENAAGVVEVGFDDNIFDLKIDGIKLFKADATVALRALESLDPDVYELHGFLVFMGLGLTLTGFHGKALGKRAVTIFQRGRWDIMKPELKTFSIA